MPEWIQAQVQEILTWIDQNKEWVFSGVGVAVITTILSFFWWLFRRRRRGPELGEETSPRRLDDQYLRNRRAMLQLVKNTWVKGVLEQSLYNEVLIELGLEKQPEAVGHPWDMVLQIPAKDDRILPPGTKITDVFKTASQSLLILGEPGSGKTTMLLEPARDRIELAEQNAIQPIPVVFNLSSWAEKRQPIEQWLVEEFEAKYNIPKKNAQPWIEHDDLLLLLDGLDEVQTSARAACINAINQFRQQHMIPLVVCSRKAEYQALNNPLRLQEAIVLQPLSPEQINCYFEKGGVEISGIRLLLQKDSSLRELAHSPLMLSIMTLAYSGTPMADLPPAGSITETYRHLFNSYIDSMFNRTVRTTNPSYPRERAIEWLSWLAKQMTQHSQTVFYVEHIYPSWLPNRSHMYSLSVRLFIGVATGLLFGIFLSVTAGLLAGIFFGLLLGTSFGFFEYPQKDEPITQIGWTWKKVSDSAISVLILCLFSGVFFNLTSEWFVEWQNEGVNSQGFFELIVWLSIVLTLIIFFGLNVSRKVEVTQIPNQGIRLSGKIAAILLLVTWLSTVLISQLLFDLTTDLLSIVVFFGLLWGVIISLTAGGLVYIRHYILRLHLYKRRHVPWNYVHFLNYATERIFLRKVGGGYIFIHRLLMDHFAQMTEEDIARLSQES